MKYAIGKKNSDKLLTISTFNDVNEAIKKCDHMIKYWKSMQKKHKMKFQQLQSWKEAVFIKINMLDCFEDVDIVTLGEQKRGNKYKLSTILNNYESNKVNRGVEKTLNNKKNG